MESVALPLVVLVVLQLIFNLSVISNRMHDIGYSGFWLLLLPILFVFWIVIINNMPDYIYYFFSNNPNTARDLIIILSFIFCLPLSMRVLCFTPGDKKANKFGPPCGNLRIDADSKFLIFFTKFLQKLHFICEVEIVSKENIANIEKTDTYNNDTLS